MLAALAKLSHRVSRANLSDQKRPSVAALFKLMLASMLAASTSVPHRERRPIMSVQTRPSVAALFN
jgi:hypothetical protein